MMAVRLAFPWTVDATQADTFGAPVVEDFKGIAVKDGDDEAGEVGAKTEGASMMEKSTTKNLSIWPLFPAL